MCTKRDRRPTLITVAREHTVLGISDRKASEITDIERAPQGTPLTLEAAQTSPRLVKRLAIDTEFIVTVVGVWWVGRASRRLRQCGSWVMLFYK